MALTDKLTVIANAIRAKTGKTDTLTLDEMPTEIEALSGDVTPPDDVPSYVKEEAEAVASAVRSVQNGKTLTFAAMADTHIGMSRTSQQGLDTIKSTLMAGQGLAYLRNILPIHAGFVLGDLTWSDGAYTVQQVYDDWNGSVDRLSLGFGGLPSAWTAGNHEINYGAGRERSMTEGEINSYIGSNSTGFIRPEGKCYGYIDFPIQKIRVIVLNTADTLGEYPESNTSVKAKSELVGAVQLQWFASTALDFSDKDNAAEWGIVLCSHHPLAYNGQNGIGRSLQILEAYRDGKSGSITYTSDKSHTVTYDFTSGAKAEIICNIHGHSHNFVYKKRSSNSSTGGNVEPWLWSVCMPCINCGRENEAATNDSLKDNYGDFDSNGNPVYYYKTVETRNGTSFCVITIDRENQTVYAHKFGAGVDRTIYYGEITTYTVTKNLSNCTINNVIASVTEGEAYSATITANSNYTLDSITVTMGGVNITSTAVSGSAINIASVTGDIVITAVAVEQAPAYTNVLKTVGYESGRLGSTGADSSGSGYVRTKYIPCKAGDTIRIANVAGLNASDSDTTNHRFSFYNSSKTHLRTHNCSSTGLGSATSAAGPYYNLVFDGNGNIIQFTIPTQDNTTNLSTVGFLRFCTASGGITDASIVTVNEEIK